MPLTKESCRARQLAFTTELEKAPEFSIISALVQQPDYAPADAVKQILLLTASSQASESIGAHLYNTACSVLENALRAAPEQQPKLVEFVIALQKTTIKDSETGAPLKHDGDLVWTELPTFGYTFGDELQSKDPLDSENTSEDRRLLEKLNAFIAQLSASSSTIYSDFSNWALIAFRLAFGPWDTPFSSTHYAVRVACLWWKFAADKLWIKVQDEGETKWMREDWRRWKQGLIESQAKLRNQATRKLIEEALTQLKRVEGDAVS